MQGPLDISSYLQSAADKTGFVRERYIESDLPTSLSNVTVMPFFGDMRSQFVLSVLLLHRYLGEVRPDRYFVLCSHPGNAGLFPYVDEYWGLADPVAAADFASNTAGPETPSDKAVSYRRGLREWFRDIVTWEDDIGRFYKDGLTKPFFDTFGKVHVALPPLRSLRMDLNRKIFSPPGYKVFVRPARTAKSWNGGHRVSLIDRGFWKDLLSKLLESGIVPVVWQDSSCHDLSGEFSGKGVFFAEKDSLDVLAAMRACHCVLDVHGGLGRYANLARCPVLCVEEKTKFVGLKDFELDDLCVLNKSYKYIFSFTTLLENRRWLFLLDNIVKKLEEMLPATDRDKWPATSEHTAVVPYKTVRQRKSKRIGSRFIKIPKM
jgi:hypothetical protein